MNRMRSECLPVRVDRAETADVLARNEPDEEEDEQEDEGDGKDEDGDEEEGDGYSE